MKPILLFIVMVTSLQLTAQTQTKTLQPKDGEDAQVMMLDSTSPNWGANSYYKHVVDSNRYDSRSGEMNMIAWTYSGCPGLTRSMIRFLDIKNPAVIPTNATITSATLTLYGIDASGNYGNSCYPGSPYPLVNNGYIYQLADTFNKHTVTWRNQPDIMHNDSVAIPPTTTHWGNLIVADVTAMVQNMFANVNTGFEMRLDTEQYYRESLFAGSTNTDSTKRPKLVITYTVPEAVENINEAGMSISLYPNPAQAQLYIDINSANNTAAHIAIYDATGRKLFEEKKSLKKGYNKVSVPVSDLARGVYFIDVASGVNNYRNSFAKV